MTLAVGDTVQKVASKSYPFDPDKEGYIEFEVIECGPWDELTKSYSYKLRVIR